MCKCEQSPDFKTALRKAYSQGNVVWLSGENLMIDTEKKAKARLSKGLIECYFKPKKEGDSFTFEPMLPNLETAKKKN